MILNCGQKEKVTWNLDSDKCLTCGNLLNYCCCSGGLGGKLGKSLQEDLGVKTPGELLPFSQLKLQELYGANTGYVCFILHWCCGHCES